MLEMFWRGGSCTTILYIVLYIVVIIVIFNARYSQHNNSTLLIIKVQQLYHLVNLMRAVGPNEQTAHDFAPARFLAPLLIENER